LMSEYGSEFGFSISHTTRNPRPGEVDGKDYHFVTREQMKEAISKGEFIEHAEFSGNIYGTSKRSVSQVLESMRICVLDIDVQGVKSLKTVPDFQSKRLVFIQPPCLNTLKTRLVERGTETEESLAKRLSAAQTEMDYGLAPGNFDLIIVNHEVNNSYTELRGFILPDIMQLRDEKTIIGASGDQ